MPKGFRGTLQERFENSYEMCPDSGCWVWTGAKVRDGYGVICEGGNHGRNLRAHRVAYELLVGQIPSGLVIDHLCRNRACVNPAHLEPVTVRENILRGRSVMAERAKQEVCSRGHMLSGDNLFSPSSGQRGCRECARQKGREYRARNIDAERARCRNYQRERRASVG